MKKDKDFMSSNSSPGKQNLNSEDLLGQLQASIEREKWLGKWERDCKIYHKNFNEKRFDECCDKWSRA